MNKFDFYDNLASKSPETMKVNGHVLMNRNKHKWHLCKSSTSLRAGVSHACGSSGPSDPSRSDYSHGSFERSAEVVTPEESVEYDRICTNCLRIIEKDFPIERVVVGTTTDESADVEKFVARREEKRNS